MKRYFQDKKKNILIFYILACIVILAVRLVSQKDYAVERVPYGIWEEQGCVVAKDSVLEMEFSGTYDEISGIGLYYLSNDNQYTRETLNADFYVGGEKISSSELKLARQTDKTQIFFPFVQKGVKGEQIKVQIYGTNLSVDKKECPSIGTSKSQEGTGTFKVNGQKQKEYPAMDAYFRTAPSADYTIYLDCIIGVIAGILLYVLAAGGYVSIPNVPWYRKKKCPSEKTEVKEKLSLLEKLRKSRNLIAGYAVLVLGMLLLLECTYHFSIKEQANKGNRININQKDEKKEYLPLKKGDVLRQDFVGTDENLSGIGIILDIEEKKEPGNIIFKLEQEGAEEPVFERTYPISDVLVGDETGKTTKGYVRLRFPQFQEYSKGTRYTASLVLENEEQAVGILLTEKGEGNGTINGRGEAFHIFMDGYYKNNLFMKDWYKLMSIFLLVFLTLIYYLCFVKRAGCVQVFLPVVLGLGIVYCFLLPVYATPDEPSHVDTAYRISNEIMGIGDTDSPYTLYKRVEDINIAPETEVSAASYRDMHNKFFSRCQDSRLEEAYGRNNLNNAPRIFYVPAALGLTLGRILNLGALPTMLLGRLFMLAVTAICMYWGIRQIPFGKTVLFMIALFPITLQQIMSFSYDAVIIGISYIYIGYCLKWIYTEERINILEAAAVMGIFMMLTACKGGVYLPMALLAFLLLVRRGKSTKKAVAFGIGIAVLMFLAFIGQNTGVLARITGVQGAAAASASVEKMYSISYFLQNPRELVRIFENTFYTQGDYLLQTTLGGRLGWLDVRLPWTAVGGFLFLVLLCALKEKDAKQYIYARDRVWLGLLCLGSFGLVMLSMLIVWTPFGSNKISGVQGRYFLPFLGLAVITLRNGQLMYQKKKEQNFIFMGCLFQMFAIAQILLVIFK